MDPYDEQRLREDVIYLHSLWHQGPPRSTSADSSNDPLHQLSSRTQCKRRGTKPRAQTENRRNRNRTDRNQDQERSTEPIQDSDKEWPCNSTSNNVAPTLVWPTVTAQNNSLPLWESAESGKEWPCSINSDASIPTSGWPAVTAQKNSESVLLPEQLARFAHFKALKATEDFFRSNNNGDDDGDNDEIGDDSDDELGDHNECDEDEKDHDDFRDEQYRGKDYRFFVGVFEVHSELREYYVKNYQNGNFSCLVCYGAGIKKASKRYRDCVALIQHSVSITKTNKRLAHRAYAKAICKVLGWDIDKLGTVVSELSANLGVFSSNSGPSDCESQGHVGDESRNNLNVLGIIEAPADIDGRELQRKDNSDNESLKSNEESTVSENSLTIADSSKCEEDPSLIAPKIMEDKELGQPSDMDSVVGDERKDADIDDLVKKDAES